MFYDRAVWEEGRSAGDAAARQEKVPVPKRKMNPDEIDIGLPVVARLIAEQFPQWAGLPITEVPSAGTDNAIYRLGEEMAVRLPRRPKLRAVAETRADRWRQRTADKLAHSAAAPLRRGPDAGKTRRRGTGPTADSSGDSNSSSQRLTAATGDSAEKQTVASHAGDRCDAGNRHVSLTDFSRLTGRYWTMASMPDSQQDADLRF
jgi:hypothetical protein